MRIATTALAAALSHMVASSLPQDTSMGPLLGGPASQSPAPTSYDCDKGLSSLSSCSSVFFAQVTAGKEPVKDPACESLAVESNYLFSKCGHPMTASSKNKALSVTVARPTNTENANFPVPMHQSDPHLGDSDSHQLPGFTRSFFNARNKAYVKTATPISVLTTYAVTYTALGGHHTYGSHKYQDDTPTAVEDRSLEARKKSDKPYYSCICPDDSYPHNQTVTFEDGKRHRLCGCCPKGAEGMYGSFTNNVIECFSDSKPTSIAIFGDSAASDGEWNGRLTSGQSCINGAKYCENHDRACCYPESKAKREQTPTAPANSIVVNPGDPIYRGPPHATESEYRTQNANKIHQTPSSTSLAVGAVAEERDLDIRHPPRYAECPKGTNAHTVDFCVPYSGGKRRTASACCVSGNSGLDPMLDGLCNNGTLHCYYDAKGNMGWENTGVIKSKVSCKNGAKECPGMPDACCYEDPYFPNAKDKTCDWMDESYCPGVYVPRTKRDVPLYGGNFAFAVGPESDSTSTSNKKEPASTKAAEAIGERDIPSWGPGWKPWYGPAQPTAASKTPQTPPIPQTTQTTLETSVVTVTIPNTNATTSSNVQNALTAVPSFGTTYTVPDFNVPTGTGLTPAIVTLACTPRAPTSGAEATKATSFMIVQGTGTTAIPAPVVAPSGLCALCKDKAAGNFAPNGLPIGWTPHQYHDAVCCGFPMDTKQGSVWNC